MPESRKPIAKDRLKKYIGTYDLAPTASAKIYIMQDSVLYLFVQGQPKYELVPAEHNKFILKNVSGYSLQFHTAPDGTVTDVLFIQPNGTFKATKKKEE